MNVALIEQMEIRDKYIAELRADNQRLRDLCRLLIGEIEDGDEPTSLTKLARAALGPEGKE